MCITIKRITIWKHVEYTVIQMNACWLHMKMEDSHTLLNKRTKECMLYNFILTRFLKGKTVTVFIQ